MQRRQFLSLSRGFAGTLLASTIAPQAYSSLSAKYKDIHLRKAIEEVASGFGGAVYASAESPILPRDDINYLGPVCAAYMRMIMLAEGTYNPSKPEQNPYQVIVGYSFFDDFSDHPRRSLRTARWSSDAAGAYQFLSSTWDSVYSQYKSNFVGSQHFGPQNQDIGFLVLHGLTNAHWWLRSGISKRGNHTWIDYDKWSAALFCDSNQWASIPGENIGASTGQRTKSHDWLWEQFTWELEVVTGMHRHILFPIGGVNADTAALTSAYGYRNHPISGGRRFHAGNDYGAPTGTPLIAPEDGTVTKAEWMGGYGNTLLFVPNSDPATELLMAHCNSLPVKAGTAVKQGDTIGTVGSTGNSTGPHLHIERRKFGTLLNPTRYLKQSVWFLPE